MAKTITLTDVAFSKSEATVNIDGAAYTNVTVDGTGKKVIVGGYGTFDATSANAVVFTADASLNGDVELVATSVSSAAATLAGANFSAATAGVNYTGTANMANITGGAGNDTLKGADETTDINAGAGNDLVSLAAGATKTSVTLGAGADTLDISAVTNDGSNKVFDYNYFEGDVIKVANSDKITLAGDGKATVADSTGSNKKVVADKVAFQDNWYGVKINDGTVDVDYFTAVGSNNVNVTKDLSKSVIANVVDASTAKSANITLGHGSDTVSLSSGVDTVAVGKSAGNNVTDISSDDIIAIDGANLSNISLVAGATKTDKVAVKYAASTVETGVATTGGSLNFNDGSKTHKLAFDKLDAATSGVAIKYATASDADWVLGAADGTSTLEVGDTTHLHETDKYVNITNIKVAADLDLKAPISLTGATGKDNKIDATDAKVGVAVWGFSSGNDSITLGSGQDTVWFGAGDGNDSITGFKYGTASDSDVLYLKDTKTLKDVNAAYDGTGNKAQFTVGSAVATVDKNSVTNSSDVAQIQLADEKTYKVAGEYTQADTVTINTDDIDGLDYYAFAGDGKAKAVSITGSKDWIFHSLYTDFYTTGANVATVDASKATGNVTLAAAASIVGGEGTNNIWTYQANTSATVTAGKGTDIIWFAENADQAVSVASFAAGTDVVKFATAQSLKEIAEGYTFADDNTDTAIKGVNNTDSVLTLKSVKATTINLVDANDKAYKASLHDNSAGLSFSTDVNIYGGGATLLSADGSVDGTVSLRLGKESRGLSSDTYYIDDAVTKFDGSKSTATFWIAGNANKGNEIIGGMTENYLYGGGAESDTLVGSIAAKDTFYFGTGDGVDKVTDGIDKEDTIALWNVADADIANVKVTVDTAGAVTVSLSDTSTLTLSNTKGGTAEAALTDGLTFTSASQTAYTYDSESKTLVKKA